LWGGSRLLIDAIKAVTDLLPDGGALSDLAAILVDTNELQTDWTNGGRLDLLIDAILADTNELQTDWTDGGRLDLLLDAISAAAIADAVWNEPLADHDTEDSVGNVLNDLTEESSGTYRLTAAALAQAPSGAGTGDVTFTYTVTVGGSACADVYVWVTATNDPTADSVASGRTNDDGEVVFYLDDGVTYYFWRSKSGVNFTNPDEETVSGS